MASGSSVIEAFRVRIGGVVQGVGFRPFIYRIAHKFDVAGWVCNNESGIEIHAEGLAKSVRAFTDAVQAGAPPASQIASIKTTKVEVEGFDRFEIRESGCANRPIALISPDLPVCADCLSELLDPSDRRFGYPYITCTDCGPRYSIILDLPYDRPATTMRDWPLCPDCAREYDDPADRRFHAQPVACRACGPRYVLTQSGALRTHLDGPLSLTLTMPGLQVPGPKLPIRHPERIDHAASLLRDGKILAIKGIGGYHLACDARNESAVQALRERKVRKEKPFALMVRDFNVARRIAVLDAESESLLEDQARPIVLLDAREILPHVAPDNQELGLMLPYTPLHHSLFAAGAPDVLVMTSANLSNEPIAFRDDDARARLTGLADAFLIGERPIARRVEDSVARVGPFGPMILRRSRGYAPGAVAALPTDRPILAVGADLKNSVTLVVDRQAFVSQHIGDLTQYAALQAFRETIEDLLRMYEVDQSALLVVHDAHPEYASTRHALELPGEHVAVQHHRAHIASVLAERGAWDKRVVGIAFDGTGYGDDASIWGGELFVGSIADGFQREGHIRPAVLPGGDAAAQHPVQAAAGFLAGIQGLPDLTTPPFNFSERFRFASELVNKNVRVFPTTSVGRLFDTVAALLGFTRAVSFEGQAAIWLEHLARTAPSADAYPFDDLDWLPLLRQIVNDRVNGRAVNEIARAFHRGLSEGTMETARELAKEHGIDTVVLSAGVFQNRLLLEEIAAAKGDLTIWTNGEVPPNDGGISLGQAAIGAITRT